LFKPAAKKNIIAFMPRKRRIEATYIRDMFRFTYPEYRNWEWHEISGKTESEVAALLGESRVFLSLSRLEGFGLTALEAMAAGCVVAGFIGIGGREYANDQNGFWAGEDDFPTCVEQLKKAVELSLDNESMQTYMSACHKTLSAYTPQTFTAAVNKSWMEILG
jgi:glycosyltransferase involved in cell wall biosynthesis